MKMEIEQNTISRDWTIVHKGRRFFVNFTNSDGQTLGLCKRENWQIHEETEDGTEELSPYVFSNSSPEEQKQAEENADIIERLVDFCLGHWEHEVSWETTEQMEMQKRRLDA